ncbi:hypothetical protein [Limosilactobacillus reuteri]|uniref:hypothetical protein n=1 Tax=Limosilactobacillus reuteri TaxID=1598 RepID=UPI001E5A0232|nr:hypothetical protein [Limosilactobacillus reuteri]MCC4361944.1 hypothetical protein [Limosilactobacillus reuteri]MCC4363772.1 hypothetical protein [Limosilactobacillus reuteri]
MKDNLHFFFIYRWLANYLSKWLWLLLFMVIYGLGWLLITAGGMIGQLHITDQQLIVDVSQKALLAGNKIEQYSIAIGLVWALVLILLPLFFKCFGVKVFKSMRCSSRLKTELVRAEDKNQENSLDKRVRAKSLVSHNANNATNKSFVVVKKDCAYIYARLPKHIESRELLIDSVDDVANDIALILDMTRTAGEIRNSSILMNPYQYYFLSK